MSLRLRHSALLLLLCLTWSGCLPTADSRLDEQRNPHYLAGKERLSALDYKGAVECFERALEENPKSALTHFELGVLYDVHVNDYAAALYHYRKALQFRSSGYPADNILQRIPACRQELVKEDSLAVSNPSVLRETERLREENQALRKQVEVLKAFLANRPIGSGSGAGAGLAPGSFAVTPVSSQGSGSPGRSTSSGSNWFSRSAAPALGDRSRVGSASPGAGRTHTVRAGETAAAIARSYQIKLPALLAANPGLEPRRMKVGQSVNIPEP